MNRIIGLGTALTLGLAPLALEAQPTLRIGGNAALIQLLDATGAKAAKVAEIETQLRRAARDAGLPLGAAAGAGVVVAAQAPSAGVAAPDPVARLAPDSVGQRPRLRPDTLLAAAPVPADALPPVTTLRDGIMVETAAASGPAPRVTVSTEAAVAVEGPRVIRPGLATTGARVVSAPARGGPAEPTFGLTAEAGVAFDDGAALDPVRLEPAALETAAGAGPSLFGGPTGY